MIIQKFWEPVVFHSVDVLEPLVSVCTKISSKGVTWSSSKISSFLLWLRTVYPAVRRKLLLIQYESHLHFGRKIKSFNNANIDVRKKIVIKYFTVNDY
jgi:hypothetical protein